MIPVPWELHELLRSSTQYRAEPGVAFANNAAAIDIDNLSKSI